MKLKMKSMFLGMMIPLFILGGLTSSGKIVWDGTANAPGAPIDYNLPESNDVLCSAPGETDPSNCVIRGATVTVR